jgi:hypothetical protein
MGITNNAKLSGRHHLPKRPGVDAPANVFFSAGKTCVHSVKLLILLTPSMLSRTYAEAKSYNHCQHLYEGTET